METLKSNIHPNQIIDPEVDGVDTRDYPDFSDAYLESGYIKENGKVRELTDAEIDYINDTHSDWVHDLVIDSF